MTTKVPKQIYLEPEQDALLKQVARETGMTEDEIIRDALERHVAELGYAKNHLDAWAEKKAFIMRLIEEGRASGRRTWRREDLYDRRVLR